MTRKNYTALADALRFTKPDGALGEPSEVTALRIRQWEKDVDAIARACKSQNANFNLGRWLISVRIPLKKD